MSQLRQHQTQLDQLNIQVKLVSFDDDFLAKSYVRSTQLNWPLMLDKNRTLYEAYGMGSGGWWKIYNPVSIAKYIGLIFCGQKPGKPGRDWRQMGGDVLIDQDRFIRLHHVSSSPHDRPKVKAIFDNVLAANTK